MSTPSIVRDLASRIEVADYLDSRSGMLVPSDWWKAVFGSKKVRNGELSLMEGN